MSKELTPLEALTDIRELVNDVQYASKIPSIVNELDIIETALKRLEIIDRLNEKYCNDIQTKLKALEIIKDYELDMKVIIYCIQNNIDYAEYVERELWVEAQDKSPMKSMPQEEFDLLKEVLK